MALRPFPWIWKLEIPKVLQNQRTELMKHKTELKGKNCKLHLDCHLRINYLQFSAVDSIREKYYNLVKADIHVKTSI